MKADGALSGGIDRVSLDFYLPRAEKRATYCNFKIIFNLDLKLYSYLKPSDVVYSPNPQKLTSYCISQCTGPTAVADSRVAQQG